MSAIIKNYGADIIKNVGDSVIFYFPKTSDLEDKNAFRNVLECCITIIAARCILNTKAYEENLPPYNYRLSADYGRFEIAKSHSSNKRDLFGVAMNLCAKINSLGSRNSIVIGDNLFHILVLHNSLLQEYHIEKIAEYLIDEHLSPYPVYNLVDSHRLAEYNKISAEQSDDKNPPYSTNADSTRNQEYLKDKKGKIMLVEDEPDLAYTYKTFLEDEGYNVDIFTDSIEALQHFSKTSISHYNLVLLDIRMPGLNGLQLYYRLKAMNSTIRIIFITALDIIQELASIIPEIDIEKGVIRKPVNQKQFLRIINLHLGSIA